MKIPKLFGFSSKPAAPEKPAPKLAGDLPVARRDQSGQETRKRRPSGKSLESATSSATIDEQSAAAAAEDSNPFVPALLDNSSAEVEAKDEGEAAETIGRITARIKDDHGLADDDGMPEPIPLEMETIDMDEEVHSAPEDADASENILSPRLARYRSFWKSADEMSSELDRLADQIALTKRIWTTVTPSIVQCEDDFIKADEVESERDQIRSEMTVVRRNSDRLERELALKDGTLKGLESRNLELQNELSQVKHSLTVMTEQYRVVGEEINRIQSTNTGLRTEITQLSGRLERETAAKEASELARIDVTSKLNKAQQSEAHTRNRAIEISVQNEKLTNRIPMLVAEQESLHSKLQATQREKGEMQQLLTSTKEVVASLEGEIQSLKGQLEAQAFAFKVEADSLRNAIAEAQRSASDMQTYVGELESTLRLTEQARQSAMNEIASLERQVEAEKRENIAARAKIAEVDLKYTTELLTIDNQREYAQRALDNMEGLMEENRRLSKFEALYRAAQAQIVDLRARFSLMSGTELPAAEEPEDSAETDEKTETAEDAQAEESPIRAAGE